MFTGYSAYMPQYIIVRLILIIFIALIIDVYFRYSLKLQLQNVRLALIRKGIPRLLVLQFIGFSLFVCSYIAFLFRSCENETAHHYLFLIQTIFVIIYIPKSISLFFQLIHDFTGLTLKTTQLIFKRKLISSYYSKVLFPKTGSIIALVMFLMILYGVFIQRNQYKIKTYEIRFDNLPRSFNDYKIVQISDLHLGSIRNKGFIENVTKRINELKPDLILFTGDMINYHTYEVEPFIELFEQAKASDGKFAVLGNHDYGDYLYCYDSVKRKELVNQLIVLQNEMGFINLRNSHSAVVRGKDTIFICGTENWSLPPYIKYGEPEKALAGVNPTLFKIMLSHDPLHWQHQIKDSLDIDLTLSGHTHAMQFGIFTRILKWSPAIWKYPYWGGLYFENNKYLIVNKGLGVIGFYGRIGIRPEISYIKLKAISTLEN